MIKFYEGCKLKAYKDLKGIITIGYGTTGTIEGVPINPDTVITQQQAEDALMERLEAFTGILSHCVKPVLSQNELDALCCLIYNVGITNFRGSKLLKAINLRDEAAIKANWLDWDHVGGQVVAGLTARRQAEYNLFIR